MVAVKLSIVDALVVAVVSVAASIAMTGVILPAPSSIPLLAVTTPIESTKVTSSYVMVPATEILPLITASPLTVKSPLISPPLERAVLAIPTHYESVAL